MELVNIIIAVAVIGALAYYFVFKKKAGDVNNDGAVNVEDAKVAVEKVEVAVEAAVEEVKTVAKKTVAKVKTTAAKAKPTVKKTGGGKPSDSANTNLK
jgi:uncharacterized protein (UPF0333 family)